MTVESLHNYHGTCYRKVEFHFQLNQKDFSACRHDIKMKIMSCTCFYNIRENRFHKKVTKIEKYFYQALFKYCLFQSYPRPCCTNPTASFSWKLGFRCFAFSLVEQSVWCYEICILNCAETKNQILSLYLAFRCTNTDLACSALFALCKI